MIEQVNVHVAMKKWLESKLTIFQVAEACGHRTVSEMYDEYMEIEANVAAGLHVFTAEEAERDDLMDLAYQLYGDLLHEEPHYLDQIIEALQRQRRRNQLAFAARFNARRRQLRGSNVVQVAGC